MMRWLRMILAGAMLAMLALPALAIQPDEVLADAGLERRARGLSAELRCLVCQNQSIDDSDAPLARDLRLLIRERLTSGDSDAQVIDYVVARYGEFVLLRPRFLPHTYILWLATPLVLLFGIAGIYAVFRRRRLEAEGPQPLSAAEKRALKKLIKE